MSTRRKQPWHRRRVGRDTRHPTTHQPYHDYPKVSTQTTDELWQRLVTDGIKRIPTPIGWLYAALGAIANAKHKPIEDVFVELNDEVAGMCGQPLTVEPGRL